MPRLTVDLRDAISFEVVSPGTYEMRVDSITGPEQGPKANYITLRYAFNDPEVARRAGLVFRNYPIDGPGAGFFRDMWKTILHEELPDEGDIDVDTDDLIGQEVTAEITNEEYEGTLRNQIAKLIG